MQLYHSSSLGNHLTYSWTDPNGRKDNTLIKKDEESAIDSPDGRKSLEQAANKTGLGASGNSFRLSMRFKELAQI
jgi:hypothetical protein